MTDQDFLDRNRALRLTAALVGIAVALGACNHTDPAVTASIPDDYRLRHPIAVEEGNKSIVVFVGRGRGGLSPEQRADVMGLAQSWLHEGTGVVTADVRPDTPTATGRHARGSLADAVTDVIEDLRFEFTDDMAPVAGPTSDPL